jgi:hypothetical protein
MKHLLISLLVPPLLLLAGGCSVYLDGYRYLPHPGFAQSPTTQPTDQPSVTGYATVVGVRTDDADDHIPASIEVRLRVQNNSTQDVTFDPRSMQLMTGELMKFAPPILGGQQAIPLPPNGSAVVDTYFPYPVGYDAGNSDLDALQLQWQVLVAGRPGTLSVEFHRWYPRAYYDPYWEYPPPVRFGIFGPPVVFVHRF